MKHLTPIILVLALMTVLGASCSRTDAMIVDKSGEHIESAPEAYVQEQNTVQTAEETQAQAPQTEGTTDPRTVSGWSFDSETGTLFLNEQQYLEKTPFTGSLNQVRCVELSGNVRTVSISTDKYDGLAVYPNLKKIILHDSVQTLGQAALDGCFNTEAIVLGSGVREIAEDAFFGSTYGEGCSGCSALQTIDVSKNNPNFTAVDNVLYSKDGSKLILYPMARQKTEFVIPDSVHEVQWFAFSCNQTIRKLTVGRGIQAIQFSLFGCSELRELILPDTLREIGESTVKWCGLRSVTIPDSVTTLGLEAFASCPDLESVHIGKGVVLTQFDDMVLINCPSLREITIDAQNPSLYAEDNVIFTKDRKTLVLYPGGVTQSAYRIPDGVETIAPCAFSSDEHLKKIYVPLSVKQIGSENFSYFVMDDESEYYEYPYEIWYAGSAAQWQALAQDIENADELTVHCSAKEID